MRCTSDADYKNAEVFLVDYQFLINRSKMKLLFVGTFIFVLIATSVARTRDWWERGNFYQVYPRSFMDSNGFVVEIWYFPFSPVDAIFNAAMVLVTWTGLRAKFLTWKRSEWLAFGCRLFFKAQWRISVMTSATTRRFITSMEIWKILRISLNVASSWALSWFSISCQITPATKVTGLKCLSWTIPTTKIFMSGIRGRKTTWLANENRRRTGTVCSDIPLGNGLKLERNIISINAS